MLCAPANLFADVEKWCTPSWRSIFSHPSVPMSAYPSGAIVGKTLYVALSSMYFGEPSVVRSKVVNGSRTYVEYVNPYRNDQIRLALCARVNSVTIECDVPVLGPSL